MVRLEKLVRGRPSAMGKGPIRVLRGLSVSRGICMRLRGSSMVQNRTLGVLTMERLCGF